MPPSLILRCREPPVAEGSHCGDKEKHFEEMSTAVMGLLKVQESHRAAGQSLRCERTLRKELLIRTR